MSYSSTLLWLGVALLSAGLAWIGSNRLETSAETLSEHYGLPLAVRGAVILAIGSSFPEFSAAVLSTLIHGEFDLGVGAIVGSAVFNVLVIPALAALAGEHRGVEANRDIVYKEAQFYMLSVSAIVITFSLAVIYWPVEGSELLLGHVSPWLASVPLALYLVYVFTQHQDTMEGEVEKVQADDLSGSWVSLGVALMMILVAVEGLIRAALALGEIFGVAPFLWGATVIAIGTSLPDALVSIYAARQREGASALGNVFGSNSFDLLVAVPVGIIVAGGTVVNFSTSLPLFAALVLFTVVVFALLRTDLALSYPEAYSLLALYAVFLLWLLAEAADLVAIIPGV